MSDKKSAVIIGGGLGGLFTGAILSKEGMKVTVIEKNLTVGGGLQCFKRFGEVFDTGMHIIGGMREGGNIYRICKYLGILDRIHVSHLEDYGPDRIFFGQDKECYCTATGREAYVEALAKSFPDQRENLKNYVDAMFRIVDELDIYNLRPGSSVFPVHSEEFTMPAREFIAKYISDYKLQNVVAFMNPLYGGRGNMTPAYVHAVISVLYIGGASRFAGGSHLFAETLADLIRENGGEIVVNDGVARVNTQERFITGVSTVKGREFNADYYICAIHPCTFFGLLDNPSALPKPYRNRLDSIPNAYSAFTLNIKFKKNSFKYFNWSAYYTDRYENIWNFGESGHNWPMGFLYITPPDLDQGEYASKMIITAPMLWEQVKQWENTTVGRRGKDYEDWKKECADKLLDKMEEIYPGFRDCVEDMNTASPLTIRDYYGAKEGTMCGFSKDYNNLALSQVPVITKIPNLLLTGQNCNLHGFCGVPLTAISTCEAIFGLNYIINKINEAQNV